MKCKKILSMLLALCMVLSTFVAVSAADVVVIDINEDYSTDIGDTLAGSGITLAIDSVGGRDGVLKATSTAGTGAYGLVGFAVEDTEGTQFTQDTFPTEGTIEYSFDVYAPSNSNVGDATAYLRTGNSFAPAGNQSRLDELNSLPADEWKTYSGTIDAANVTWSTNDVATRPVWLCFRPNFSNAGTIYFDNISYTLTQTVEDEGPELPPVSGGIEFTLAPKNVAGTLEDGVYTVTSEQLKAFSNNADYSDCAANDWLKIIPTTELDSEKTIKVSYEIKAENLVNSQGGAYADRETTLRIRDAQNGNVVPRTTYATNVPVNTGVAQLVEFEIPVADIEGYDHFGISLNMQNPLTYGDGSEYFVISNITVEYVGEEGGDEPGGDIGGGDDPIIPSDEITFTLERAVNAGTNGGNAYPSVGTVEEDAFTSTLEEVATFTRDYYGDVSGSYGMNCSYQPWVWIMPDSIDTAEDWYVSYDLTTEGIINSLGSEYTELTVRTRFYNGNTEIDSSYRPSQNVTVNTGEPVNIGVQVDTSKVTGDVTKIGLVLDIGSSVQYNDYVGSDAYFEISNVVVDYGTYEAPEQGGDEPGGDEPIVPPPGDEPTDELTYVAIGEQGNNFDTDMGDVKVGTTNIAGEIVDLDGENVLKVTSTGTTSHNGIVGIAIKDTEGNKIKFTDLQPYDKVSWSVDLMMEDTSTLPVAGDGAYVGFRYGSWTPSEAMVNAGNFGGSILTPGQWKTISGTKLISELNWQSTVFNGDVYFFVRPNFTGNSVMYIDNIEVTVEKEFVPTILEVTEVEVGADNVTLNVETDGVIEIDSLVDYILIDGAEVNADNITVESVDANNTTVTIIGLAPGTEYEIAVTGALNARDREVGIASEADCTVSVTTIAEVDVEAGISNDTVSFSLTNNLSEPETIHVVLLRCKGNTVIETIATVVEATPGEPIEDSLEVTELGAGEYYRVFAWSYEDGAINSLANLIDLD